MEAWDRRPDTSRRVLRALVQQLGEKELGVEDGDVVAAVGPALFWASPSALGPKGRRTLAWGDPAMIECQLEGSDEDHGDEGQAPIRKRWGSRKRWVLWGLSVAVVLFVVASVVLFVWPPTDKPTHADAILSLYGRNEPAREGLAISLAERGYAPVLLFSQGRSTCPTVPRVKVVCFEPSPARTVGEVEFAARYPRPGAGTA